MNKKRLIKILGWGITLLLIIAFIWSLINYRLLKNEVGIIVATWGYLGMFLLTFILESAPVVIGPNAPLIVGITMKLNPVILTLLLYAAILPSGILTFYLGKKSSDYVKKFIEAERMHKFEDYFQKYGVWIGVLSAIAFIPYIPAILGIFKMRYKHFFFIVIPLRIVKFVFTLIVLFWIFGVI